MSVVEKPSYTADQALARLVAGNERFVRGEARFPTVQKEILAGLAAGQRPYATILGCSDSRVAARTDLRRRIRRAVHRAGRRQRDLRGSDRDVAVCRDASEDAALRRAGPRRLRGRRRRARGEEPRRGDAETASRGFSTRSCPAFTICHRAWRAKTNAAPPSRPTCAGRCARFWRHPRPRRVPPKAS